MQRIRYFQTLLGTTWLGIAVVAGPSGCGGRDAYAVVKIDRGSLQLAAQTFCVDVTVGSLSAQLACYSGIPDEVAFWLPYGTLHHEPDQGSWVGVQVDVQVRALDGAGCVVASGSVSQAAKYVVRLDLTVGLKAEKGCAS